MLNWADTLTRRIFFEVYDHLPRGGPGNTASTLRALSLADALPATPQVLDIGCGPGMQTLDLARSLPRARIWAIDNHEPFVSQLSLKARGFQGRIIAQVGDMFNLRFADETFDLIWSEGAIYNLGFENGLKAWNPLLKSGGYVAVTEATWLKTDPPEEAVQYWRDEYPAMATVPDCLGMIDAAGYQLIGYFELPESDWWDYFYTPLMKRVGKLKQKYRSDEDALAILIEMEGEADFVKKYFRSFNYVFYIGKKK